MRKTIIAEVNDFGIVWNNLLRLGGNNFKLKKVDKIAEILSAEYLSQNKNRRLFNLVDKFEPSVSFSKNVTYPFRIAWTCIDQERSAAVKRIFGLYKDDFSQRAVEFVLKSYFSLTPFIGIGIDADTPRLKIYAYLRDHRRKGITAEIIVKTIESLGRFLNINISEPVPKEAFFVTLGVDFYSGKKYAVKVYHQLHNHELEEEFIKLLPRFGYTKQLIDRSTGNSLCLSFGSNSLKPEESVNLRFYRYPSDFDFNSMLQSLGYSDRKPFLEQFIKANSVNCLPLVPFLGFGQDKFTVYLHPGL